MHVLPSQKRYKHAIYFLLHTNIGESHVYLHQLKYEQDIFMNFQTLSYLFDSIILANIMAIPMHQFPKKIGEFTISYS